MNILVENMTNIPKDSLSFLCRTCLLFTEIVNIKNFSWDGVKLEQILSFYTSISVTDENILPKNMCKSCIKKLYNIHRFLSNCKRSEEILQDVTKHLIKEEREIQEIEILRKSTTASSNNVWNDDDPDNDFPDNDDADLVDEIKVESIVIIGNQKTNKRSGNTNCPPYTCVLCEVTFNTFSELRVHKKRKHRLKQTFVCPYCNATKQCDKESFFAHVRVHTGEKPNKCPRCDRAFNYKSDLKRHMGTHSDVKRFKCRFCGKGYSRRDGLKDHERTHTGEKLICSVCGKGFHSHANLFVHERTHKILENELGLYQCDICKKRVTTAQILKTHRLLHQPKEFGCETCEKRFINKSRLEAHVASAHGDARYPCNVCGKIFKQRSYLEEHAKSHTGENVYPCKDCTKRFASRTSLSQHRRIHTGDPLYRCEVCLAICVNRRALEGHLRKHTGEKPFACRFCGKAFAIKGVLQHHLKIHTGEKKHLCNMCGKGFSEARGLRRHLQVHQKDTS